MDDDRSLWQRLTSPRVAGWVLAILTLSATAPILVLFNGWAGEGPTVVLQAASVGAAILVFPTFWAADKVTRGTRPRPVFLLLAGWIAVGAAVFIGTGIPLALIAWLTVTGLVAVAYRSTDVSAT